MPDQVRHDGQKLNAILNYGTVWKAGIQFFKYFWMLALRLRGDKLRRACPCEGKGRAEFRAFYEFISFRA
jgi:hypothetical protein